MSVVTDRQLHQTIDANDGNMIVQVHAINGLVQTIQIKRTREDPTLPGGFIYIPHDNTISALIDLRILINQVINESQTQGIE